MELSYRREIDGLRSIAVLSVIFYHAQIAVFQHNFFKGGFVGVDIFFVISGYLISRILISELLQKGKINFVQFYERRARRILPILFTVFLVSFPFAYKYLLPGQFIEYAKSILSATFFGSNIFFYFNNTQYGAQDSLLQPFLHTWSLGIEEQFYFIFPFVLLAAYKFAKNYVFIVIGILILISLIYANWQSTKNIQLNFFLLPSRLWELGIGSILAFYELKYDSVKNALLGQTMPILGFTLIVYSVVFFNNQTPHPSLITIIPTLGAALIILFSGNSSDIVSKILSLKPIVGIGLISYSMYLWHYPIFAFASIADSNNLQNDEKFLLVFLIIILSIISYFFIEKPIRFKLIGIKFFIKIIFTLFLITTIFFSYLLWQKEKVARDFNSIYSIDLNTKPWEELKSNNKSCWDNDYCEIGLDSGPKILFSGDSVLHSIASGFVSLYKNEYKIKLLNYDACYMLTSDYFGWKRGAPFYLGDTLVCNKNIHNLRDSYIDKYDPIIVIGGMLDVYMDYFDNYSTFKNKINNKDVAQGVKEKILNLLDNGHRVVVVLPGPRAPISSKDFMFQKFRKLTTIKSGNELIQKISRERYNEIVKRSHDLLLSIDHKNYLPINIDNIFCDKEYCYFNTLNELILYDDVHPTVNTGKKISRKIYNEIKSKWPEF